MDVVSENQAQWGIMRRKSIGTDARGKFPTTRWGLICTARPAGGEPGYQQALTELFQNYWQPLYAFSRRTGCSHEDAMDCAQDFFAYMLNTQFLDAFDPKKGRFRSFLLVSFKNYIANQRRAASALRRGGGQALMSLTAREFESVRHLEPVNSETPEAIFEREWALALLRRVRTRLEQECMRSNKEQLFALLEPHLVKNPIALPHSEIARLAGVSTATVTMTLYRLRRRYGEILREEVADTIQDPADIDEELRELVNVLSGNSK